MANSPGGLAHWFPAAQSYFVPWHMDKLGCQWLNMTGGPPFAELRTEQQIAVVEWMATADWNQVPRRFYELLRQAVAEIYYSDPAAWNGLSITQPPQPMGYPPPWQ